MRIKDVLKLLAEQGQSQGAVGDGEEEWHEQSDSLLFLLDSQVGDVPIYVASQSFFLNSLAVDLDLLQGAYVDELLGWNFGPSSGYGYGYSVPGDSVAPFLCEPTGDTVLPILNGSIPPFFLRHFDGQKTPVYMEINQRLSHVLDIHWVGEKEAWCKLNRLGEVVPVAACSKSGSITCCTIVRKELDFYLFLSNCCLVRFFEISKGKGEDAFLLRENEETATYRNATQEIYARRSVYRDKNGEPVTSRLRGFQIVRCAETREQMLLRVQGKEARRYASFIINDWKHGEVREWSSDPAQLGNYFVESALPLSVSPAFFKPEVLLQYRQDPSRYTIECDLIRCKGAWSLPYDVNDEGQVFAYIYELSRLPYEEQLRWRAFNQEPRGGISARALAQDFEGQWVDFYNPLYSLKQILEHFPRKDSKGRSSPIWTMRNVAETRDLAFLGYVFTESRKEWEDQILALATIVVEGLNTKFIAEVATALNCRDGKLGSGKQLARILEALGLSDADISAITEPMAKVWKLRSAIVAHPGGDLPGTDLSEHFRLLIQGTDIAMRKLALLVEEGLFSVL